VAPKSANTQCDTGAASRANTKLSKDYVAKVCSAFRMEAKRLGLARIPVDLVFDRTARGVSYIKVALIDAPDVPVATVLSEGERRIAAVAGFFADLTESGDTSTLVFDDPVSSLDQEYREAVAQRLLLEAKTRQVLVFSHDSTFVHYLYEQKVLMDLADRANGSDETEFVALHYLHIARSASGAGTVTDAEHWRHVPVRERIGRLKDRIQSARALHAAGEDMRYEKEAKDIVGGIRETWESFVEQELLDGIVMRHERAIQTRRLKRIIDLSDTDVASVTLGMSIESTYLTGHASPVSAGTTIGDPDWLLEQITRLADFRGVVLDRRKRK
jgi:energy-coupling factor transporter ATP-binding protein EcfA2